MRDWEWKPKGFHGCGWETMGWKWNHMESNEADGGQPGFEGGPPFFTWTMNQISSILIHFLSKKIAI